MTGFVTPPAGSGLPYIYKDPDARLDYAVDWTEWLIDETIVTAVFEIELGSGMMIDDQTTTGTIATVKLSGGTANTTYRVRCRITTTADRTEDRSFNILCATR